VLLGFWMEEEEEEDLRVAIWVEICLKEGRLLDCMPTLKESAAMMASGLKSWFPPTEHPK
jgi:hypothetical protein